MTGEQINFSSITGGSARVSPETGDGARRLVVLRLGAPVTGTPVNGVDYNPDLTFGDGDQIAPGDFTVLDLSSPSVFSSVQGLVPASTYHVAVFEYNGTGQGTEYLATPLRGQFTTLSQPTQNVSNTTFSLIEGNSVNLEWTDGNGDGRLLTMRKGSPVSANPVNLQSYATGFRQFGAGAEITSGNFVVDSPSNGVEATTIFNFEPSTTYHGSWHEYNGQGGRVYAVPGAIFSFTTAERPTRSATFRADDLDPAEGDRYGLEYYDGNGRGRLIVVRQGTDLTGVQPTDGIRYNTDIDFGDGDEVSPGVFTVSEFNFRQFNPVGNNFSTATVRNLLPGTTYTMGVYEFDRADDYSVINYQTEPPLTRTFTTAAAPTASPTNGFVIENNGTTARLKWTAGNGDGNLVVIKPGSAVDFTPADLLTYGTSSNVTTRNLGNDNFGIYRGNRDSVDLTNMTAGTNYHVAVWAYNGSAQPVYGATPLRFDFEANLTPTISTGEFNLFSIEGDRLSLYADRGNGQKRLIVARPNTAPQGEPQDGTVYQDGGSEFGQGSTLGPDEFVIYAGTGAFSSQTRITVTGLEIGTEYHFAAYEYNEDAAGVPYYRRVTPGRGQEFTAGVPTESAADIGVLNLNAVSVTLNPTPGNGERRLIVVRKNDPVSWTPENLSTYQQSNIFGNGVEVEPNAYPVYRAPFGNAQVERLEANTTYHAANFELNGANFPVYEPTPTTVSFTTPRYPTTGGTGMDFDQVGATRVTGRYFRGNGGGRLLTLREVGQPESQPQDDSIYSASDTFGLGEDLGNQNFVVATEEFYRPGNRISVPVTGLVSDTRYVLTAYELATNSAGEVFYRVPGITDTVRTVARPTVAPVNLQVNDLLAQSATLAWTTGNGDGEYILVSQNEPVSPLFPDGGNVFASSGWNSEATTWGNARGVYWGAQTEVNLTNLTPGTPYYVQAQAYNGIRASAAYMQSGPTLLFRTPGAPSVQATMADVTDFSPTRISLEWEPGNGTDRIVVAKKESAVDAAPVDGIIYTPNTFFGSGDDLGNGNYVIAAGDFDTISVTNLIPGCEYFFAVFEYNVDGSTVLYNIDTPTVAQSLATLPVGWRYVRAAAEAKGSATVEWGTEWEEGNHYFTVERASSGGQFVAVAELPTDPGGTYTFRDEGLNGGDYFYRVRQTDYSGAFTFSETVSVQIAADQLVLYPNPARDFVQVQGAAAGARFELKSEDGRTLREGSLPASGLNVTGLPPGVYLLGIDGIWLRLVVAR